MLCFDCKIPIGFGTDNPKFCGTVGEVVRCVPCATAKYERDTPPYLRGVAWRTPPVINVNDKTT